MVKYIKFVYNINAIFVEYVNSDLNYGTRTDIRCDEKRFVSPAPSSIIPKHDQSNDAGTRLFFQERKKGLILSRFVTGSRVSFFWDTV